MGLLVYLKQSTNMPSWIFLSLVAGTGTGMLFSAQGFAAQASVSNTDVPFAGAMYSFFRAFGQVSLSLLICYFSYGLGANSGVVMIPLFLSKELRQFRSSQLLHIFLEFTVLICRA